MRGGGERMDSCIYGVCFACDRKCREADSISRIVPIPYPIRERTKKKRTDSKSILPNNLYPGSSACQFALPERHRGAYGVKPLFMESSIAPMTAMRVLRTPRRASGSPAGTGSSSEDYIRVSWELLYFNPLPARRLVPRQAHRCDI